MHLLRSLKVLTEAVAASLTDDEEGSVVGEREHLMIEVKS